MGVRTRRATRVSVLCFCLQAACGGDGGGVTPVADTAQGDASEVFVPDTEVTDVADTADAADTADTAEAGGCGDVTATGLCQGKFLSTCVGGRVRTRDCAAETGAGGQPLTCGWADAQGAYDCVESAASNGCGSETSDGRCDGTTIVYCESPDSGVATVECAPDYECGERDGFAECRLPGSAGCGRVTYEGSCEGNVAVYCNWEITDVVRYDCGQDGMTCGYVDDQTGYYCLGTATGGAYSVTGSFWFEKPALSPDGLGAVSELPVRNAIVQVRAAADDSLLASGVTDGKGAFTVAFDAPAGDVYALAMAMADDARYAITVRDCPLEDCDGAGYVHAVYSEPFTPSAASDIGGWVASREGSAGAFNIFDVFMHGQDFARDNFGAKPPLLTGQWAQGSKTTCGELSCYTARSNTIYVLGMTSDTDEFDDPVLGHEFGHYLAEVYSRSDSPGGSHDGSPTDPRLAWDEGYGTFAGCELMGASLYIDTAAGGASVTDISDTGLHADPNGGLSQPVAEFLVSEILWTLSHGGSSTGPLGSAVIFDVLGAYFPTGWLADRGVEGVDLVDFLDGLMCRGSAPEQDVRSVVVVQKRFPYDFGGPGSCR